LKNVADQYCQDQAGLDYVLLQKSDLQHRAVLLAKLMPYLNFVPEPIEET
jgi:hypothetical protein